MPLFRRAVLRAAALAVLAAAVATTPLRAAEPVTVFAAASTTDAVQAAVARFQAAHPDVPVRTSFASSSTLAKQIANGAPADLYLSANVAWMDYLEQRGAVAGESRVDLLANRLVLVRPRRDAGTVQIDPSALPDLLGDRRLAIGDPSHVPAGQYAKAALQSLGLWAQLRDRAAYASDVRAALALVARGETAAGIVYATDARISDDVVRVATFPADSHPPIRYPFARVAGRGGASVRALYDFLCGPEAADAFRQHGFEVLADRAGS